MRTFNVQLRVIVVAAGLLAMAVVPSNAQPRFDWVRNGSSSWGHEGLGLGTKSDGSVVAGGQFYYQMNLGVTNIFAYANNPHNDVFLLNYSANGELLWVRADGGFSPEFARGVGIDSAGSTYLTGSFYGTAYFGSTNLTSVAGSEDVFVAKYSPDGMFLWAVRAGGNSTDTALSLALDSQGNVFVCGYYHGQMDFGTTNLTGFANADAFIAKISSDGTVLWASTLAGAGNELPLSVASLPTGDCVVGGYFSGLLQFDERCVVSRGSEDAFVARISGNGEVIWVRSGGSTSSDFANAVAVTSHGEILAAGTFYNGAVFGSTNLSSVGGQDFFLAKYSGAGALLNVKTYGGNADDVASRIVMDTEGNAYVGGHFVSSPLQFPGTNLFTTGSWDVFCARFDRDGTFRWAFKAGGGNQEFLQALAIGAQRHLYISGRFGYNSAFGTTNISTSTDPGFYVAKYNRDLPVLVTQPESQVVTEGALLALSVTVTGTAPFAYQWQFNGTNLPLSTNVMLALTGVTTNAAGAYSVIVSNYEGRVASESAIVQVRTFPGAVDSVGLVWSTGGDAPWFSQTNFSYLGTEAARSGPLTNNQQSWLQTTVIGPARIYFQWKISSENGYDFLRFIVNGAEVTNTSGKIEWKGVSTLLPAGTNTLRWAYTKDESESVGQDSGWLDAVTIAHAPVIVAPPSSVVVTAGVDVALSAIVSGTPPFAYQWRQDGVSLAGGTNAILVLSNVAPAQAGQYVLSASNDAGVAMSSPAMLTVLVPPTLTTQPISQTVSAGGNVLLSVSAEGAGPFTYQWRRNGIDIEGATNQTLELMDLQVSGAGLYDVLVSSPMGATLSAAARIALVSLAMRPVLTIDGVVGSPYRIEYRDDLNQTNWTALTNVVLETSPWHFVDLTALGFPKRFYRAVPE